MIGNVLRRVNMFWLMLLTTFLTYCEIMKLETLASEAARNMLTDPGFSWLFAMSDFDIVTKIASFLKFVAVAEVIYIFLATDIQYRFSEYVDKFAVKVPEKVRVIGNRVALWLFAFTGIGCVWADIFTMVYGFVSMLPALKYELENGMLKNVD